MPTRGGGDSSSLHRRHGSHHGIYPRERLRVARHVGRRVHRRPPQVDRVEALEPLRERPLGELLVEQAQHFARVLAPGAGVGEARIVLLTNLDDNCPAIANPDQTDGGSAATPGDLPGATPNGTGDACECGDGTGDGRANAADLQAIRDALGGSPAALLQPARCSVEGMIDPSLSPGDTALRADCSIVDATVLARQIAGALPGVLPVCSPAVAQP